MVTHDIFSKISARLVEGMMLHDKLANYYDFLGLMGFKRLHEYYFLRDAVEMRCVNRYHINHYNTLLRESEINDPFVIPSAWYNYTRKEVSAGAKATAVKTAVDAWCSWQRESKRIYEQSYRDLCDTGEVAAACKVKELVAAADQVLKHADRLAIQLQSMDYDLAAICLMQNELHERYDRMEREMGVTIC